MDIAETGSLFAPFRGKRMLIGFSGGADSTAALLLALRWREKYDLHLTAVHIHHHLRGAEADAEAAAAAMFAAAHGVEFVQEDVFLEGRDNLEARARAARLEVWRRLCCAIPGGAVVITGHHADDRVENLLLRLGRGANVSGLTGLHRHSVVEQVEFFRPLLQWRRSDIEKFLLDQGIGEWAADSSNRELFTQRNILRHKILPEYYQMLPGGSKGVLRSLMMLELDAGFIEECADQIWSANESSLRSWWHSLHPAIFYRVLIRQLSLTGGSEILPHSAAVAEFSRMVDDPERSGTVEFAPGIFARCCGDGVDFFRKEPTANAAVPLYWTWRQQAAVEYGKWRFCAEKVAELPADAALNEAYFDFEQLPDVLEIYPAFPGEKMVPFGRSGAEKLKKLRVDRRLAAGDAPPAIRSAGDGVIWFPQVRHSGKFPVIPGRKIVRLKIEECENVRKK